MLTRGRLDIGLYFLRMVLSRYGFFNRGFTPAVVKAVGKIPVSRGVLIIFRIERDKVSYTFLRKLLGTESRTYMEEDI